MDPQKCELEVAKAGPVALGIKKYRAGFKWIHTYCEVAAKQRALLKDVHSMSLSNLVLDVPNVHYR